MHSRNVPAMDTKTSVKIWSLTKYQWAVYFWLLGHTKRNPSGNEDHCYIYRNSFTLQQIRAQTGIKTDPTIRAAFQKLVEVGAIREDKNVGAFILYRPPIYVPMNTSIILTLLSFNQYIDSSVLILSFSILSRLYRFCDKNQEPAPTFTKTEFGCLLGLAKQNVNEGGIVLTLALLKGLGIIDYETIHYSNRLGVDCVKYKLIFADPMSDKLNSLLNHDECIDQQNIDRIWKMVTANIE